MDRIALHVPDGESVTYAQLVDRAAWLEGELVAGGWSGSRIAIVMRNDVGSLVSALALASVATCVPVNPAYTEAEITRYLAALRVEALAAAGATPSAMAAARALEIAVLDGRATRAAQPEAPLSHVGFLFQTSGTTSAPRGVPLTNANIVAGARNVVSALELTEADATWLSMPLFHVHGLIGAALATLASSGTIFLPPAFHAAALLDALDTGQPTWYTASPARHHALAAFAETTSRSPKRHLRFARNASAPMTTALRERLHALLGGPIVNAYGMTEAAHQIASSSLGSPMAKSVGRPVGCEVRIRGEDGSFPLQGETGEVFVRGASLAATYDPPSAGIEDGWLRTGDLGYFCRKGTLHLVARTKEVINRGGEKIAPAEIDDVLAGHPAVLEAAAYGAPSERLGETVAAAVVLRPGALVSADELQRYTAARLATFKVPQTIRIVDALPRGGTGKVLRRALSDGSVSAREEPALSDSRAPAPLSVEEIVMAIWRDVLDVPNITDTSDFFELGGDSLSAQDAVLRVAERFGTEASMSEFFAEPTVRGMAGRVRSQRARGTAAHSPVIPMRPGSGTGTIVVVQGAGFSVDHYRPLIRHIASDLRVVGLQDDVLAGSQSGWRSLTEFADHLADELRGLTVPPYYLIGYSSGGVIAVEVARTLGSAAAQVVLLDAIPAYQRGARAWVRRGAEMLRTASASELRNYARWTASGVVNRLARLKGLTSAVRQSRERRERSEGSTSVASLIARYRPSPTAVPLALIASRWSRRKSTDPDFGWRRAARTIEVFEIADDHATLLLPAAAGRVASIITPILERQGR